MNAYIGDLMSVLDMEALRSANLNFGVAPLGGAGVHDWECIRDQYQLSLTVVNDTVDPTFARPVETEDGYKIYAESFRDEPYLHRLIDEAHALIDKALALVPQQNAEGGHGPLGCAVEEGEPLAISHTLV